ncbi:MAG: hypothetical protein V3W31_09010 [Thermodesulfobacteriota bacterium]
MAKKAEKKGESRVEKKVVPGAVIPKHKGGGKLTVKDWGRRRNEKALIYLIPNPKNPKKPSQKGITEAEFEQAYTRIMLHGEFTREWFDENMKESAKEAATNFTAIGGIFEMVGIADYDSGAYKRKGS